MQLNVYTIFGMMGAVALVFTVIRGLLKKSFSNSIIPFIQYFIGSLFIFSGFVKAVDPMGTSYKMHDYFEAMHISFLNDFSTPMAVGMIVAEIMLGTAIIMGWRPKLTASLLLLLNVFFLLLTGFTFLSGYTPTIAFLAVAIFTICLISIGGIIKNYKLIFGGFLLVIISLLLMKFSTIFFTSTFQITGMKVTDCGCFGDFIKLKPWETFYKDVILCLLSLYLVLNYQKVQTLFSAWYRNTKMVTGTIFTLFFCLYNFIWSEPVLDFRAYSIGSDLNKNRTVIRPEKKEFIFIYKNKKTNEEKEFKTAELGNLTEDWEYKDRKDIVLDEGIPAKISNLFISNEDGEDITEDLLHNENYSLAVVAYKLGKTDESAFKNKLNLMAEKAEKAGVDFYVLTSEDAEDFRHKNQCAYPFYKADETPLKTIMRSNPGLVLLKNGVVINKWHKHQFPTFEELNTSYFKK